MDKVTGIILAGGVSRRLNYRNKALLKIDHRSVIEFIIEAMSEVTEEILLITNSPNDFEHLKLPMFGDILPGSGSLGGIYTGLKVSKTHYNLILACDIPFIQPCLLKFLIDQMEGYDIALPVTPDGYQPTCAIYSKDCIQAIETQIHDGNLKIADFFPNVRVNKINFGAPHPCYKPGVFFNINTSEDYSKALTIAKKSQP